MESEEILPPRLFSVRAANAFVPRLQEIFGEARALLERAQAAARALAEQGHPIEDVETLEVDRGAPAEVRSRQREVAALLDSLREKLTEVAELGAEVKSADGLVDFRSRRKGEVVYLCWRFGESEVAWWHDLGSGYAGRARISDPSEFEGDLLQ